jgi:parvulin-like peptidyl-prolyl isomerase
VCYRFFSSEVYTCVLGWQGVTLYFFFVDTNPAALSGEYIYICPTVTFCMKQVKASHILVKTESEAEKILEDLKKGASFEKIAKEKSECPSKKRGGSLGWFGRGKMVPEFEKAAFSLKKGELSDIVKTRFGYHIITVTDTK